MTTQQPRRILFVHNPDMKHYIEQCHQFLSQLGLSQAVQTSLVPLLLAEVQESIC